VEPEGEDAEGGRVALLGVGRHGPEGVEVPAAGDSQQRDRFRVVATSAGPDRPIAIASLGITVAGGAELDVRHDERRWPTTAEAFRRAWAEAERADREAERADREAQRADREVQRAQREAHRAARLAALLREAGLDPDG